MVNPGEIIEPRGRDADADAVEWRLILSYAPASRREGLAALLALDRALVDVLHATRDPMLAQLRYTWWHGQLTALDHHPAPAIPVLQALSDTLVAAGISGSRLSDLVEGWEAVLDDEPGNDAMPSSHARLRGAALFAVAAEHLGGQPNDAVMAAGMGWSLADLSRRLPIGQSAPLRRMAMAELDRARRAQWPAQLRSLGAMAHRARMDLDIPDDLPLPATSGRRVARLAWHRLTGR